LIQRVDRRLPDRVPRLTGLAFKLFRLLSVAALLRTFANIRVRRDRRSSARRRV
jgi:hypothetical protein